jgi:hypothetical protein
LPCRGAETGARGGDAGERGRGEKGRPFRYPVARRATRRRRAGAGSGVAGVGRKGKADKRDPPVSCPGRKREGRPGRFAKLGWAGSRGLIRVRGREKEGKKVGW